MKGLGEQAKKLEKNVSDTNAKLKEFTKTGREIRTAANGMKFFTDAAGRARKVNGQFVTTAEAAAAGLENQGRAANNAANNFGRLQKAIRNVGIGFLIKRVVTAAATFNTLQLRMQLLTSEFGEYEQAQEVAARAAEKFGLSNREAAQGVTDIFARLRPLGVSLKDIESTFVGFNSVAKLSGVEAQQASAAFTQLAQALGSGRLQGDEFRSISEQVPGILKSVADVTGIAQGELREYASEGLITSDVIIAALRKAEREAGGAIEKIVEKSDVQKFKDFQNAVDKLAIAVGNQLLPTLIPLIQVATDIIKFFSEMPKPFKDTITEVVLFAAKAILLTKAIQGIIALKTGVVGMLTTTAGAAATAGNSSATAAGKVNMLAGAFRRLLPLMIAFSAFDFLRAGMKSGASLEELQARLEAGGTGATFEGATRETVEAAQKQARLTKKAVEKELAGIKPNPLFSIPGVGPVIAGMSGSRAQLLNLRELDAETVLGLNPDDFKSTGEELDAEIEKIRKRFAKLQEEIDKDKGKNKGGKEADPADQAVKTAVRQLGATNKRIELARARNQEERNMITLQQNIREIEGQRLLIGDSLADQQIERLRIEFTINQLNQNRLDTAKAEADQQKKNADNLKKAQDAEAERTQKLADQYQGIADTIADGVVDALKGAVDGTQTLAESASNLLNNLANDLLMVAKNMLLFGNMGGGLSKGSGLLGNLFGGFLADGGTATGGRSFVVGERGPELFTPGRTGSVTPNSALGGSNIVVNVDASGSSVQGDGPSANQLGKVIGAAVQAELIKQKRPGGLLTR
jgi:tape measure domain-containing protein